MSFSTLVAAALAGTAILPAAALESRDEWQVPPACLYLTNDYNWQGNSSNVCIEPTTCLDDLPIWFAGNVSSAGPDDGYTCFLYDGEACTGTASLPIVYPGNDNLTAIGFDKRAKSLRCYKWCAYTASSSSSTSAKSTSTTTVTSTSTTAGTTISTTLSSFLTTSSFAASSSSTSPVSVSSTSVATVNGPPGQANTASVTFPTAVTMTHTYADGSTVLTTMVI